jgi:hypothetical protein
MASQFNSEKVLTKINEIENSFPVNEWNVNGLKIWPFLRTALAYTQNRNPDTRKATSGNKKSLYIKYLRYALIVAKLPLEYFRFKKKITVSTRMFFGAVTHRAHINGVLFNRYYDLAIDDFRKQGEESIAFDNGFLENKRRYYNGQSLFGLPMLYLWLEIKRKLTFSSPVCNVHLPRYDEFLEHALNTFEHKAPVRTAFNRAAIVKRATVLFHRTESLKKMLKGTPVKKAYFLCYYSSLFYPLIAACNDLGIATTDIQHGGMGEGHYSYGRWTKSPSGGYELLPRFFWTWDKYSAAMINKWAALTTFHWAIAAGNPWMDACLRMYKHVPKFKDYILVNMTSVTLDDFFVAAIRHFGATEKWILRMHPRQYQHRATLQEQLKKEMLNSIVEIEDSNEVPLPISLQHCKHFISRASGSVIEAVELGYKPLLLRSEIMSYYDHYIRNGNVTVLSEDSAKYLIEHLSNTSPNTSTKTNREAEDKFNKFENEAFRTTGTLEPDRA